MLSLRPEPACDVKELSVRKKIYEWSGDIGIAPALRNAPTKVTEPTADGSTAVADNIIPDNQLCRLIANIWYVEAIFAAHTPDAICVDFYPSLIIVSDALSLPGIHYQSRHTRPELDWKRVWG